jgi:hypothetical protein
MAPTASKEKILPSTKSARETSTAAPITVEDKVTSFSISTVEIHSSSQLPSSREIVTVPMPTPVEVSGTSQISGTAKGEIVASISTTPAQLASQRVTSTATAESQIPSQTATSDNGHARTPTITTTDGTSNSYPATSSPTRHKTRPKTTGKLDVGAVVGTVIGAVLISALIISAIYFKMRPSKRYKIMNSHIELGIPTFDTRTNVALKRHSSDLVDNFVESNTDTP